MAPLPPAAPEVPDHTPAPEVTGRRPLTAFLAALVVVALVVGFGSATLVLDSRDSKSNSAAIPTVPGTLPVPTIPGGTTPSTNPSTTAPADPNESVLGGLILQQSDVPIADTVSLLDHGADLTVATLDLCNGTFPSEKQRSARRQVALTDQQDALQGTQHLSTEAVLYRTPAGGAQAFAATAVGDRALPVDAGGEPGRRADRYHEVRGRARRFVAAHAVGRAARLRLRDDRTRPARRRTRSRSTCAEVVR